MALGLIAGGGPAGSNPKAMTTSGESLLPPLPEGARGTFGSAFNQGGPSTPLILGDGAPPSSARDYELLGDLQLKQGRIDEAVRVYKRAVELGGGSKELAGLYRKLAQAHLMRDQDTAALEAIEKALQSRRQVSAKGKSTPRTPKAAPLPAQLIVSVQKGVADHYARGAITFDQFRRAAHVELRKFTDTEK
jgi:tetratricopeptide (TPR) repeat protein